MKNAFTIAEVLITLGIIGIVAAMTMPSLITSHKEKQTIVSLKKFYSILEQSIRMSQLEDENDFSHENIIKQFKTTKKCIIPNYSCAPKTYKYLSGNRQENWGTKDIWAGVLYAQLVDGSIIRYSTNNDCIQIRGTSNALKKICGEFSIDINGNKLPNQMGKDVFYFYITKHGVVPFGSQDETKSSFGSFKNCSTRNAGLGCAAWVLSNENMDYLHCDDLSWEGKTSCR